MKKTVKKMDLGGKRSESVGERENVERERNAENDDEQGLK